MTFQAEILKKFADYGSLLTRKLKGTQYYLRLEGMSDSRSTASIRVQGNQK